MSEVQEVTAVNQDRYQAVSHTVTHESQIDRTREVIRDSYLADEQALRLNCVALANKDFSREDVLVEAERIRVYIETGEVTAKVKEEVKA